MTARRRASLYFSFRSPFSWLLVRRLLERLPDAGERIEFIPYWEPDPRMAGALGERGASVLYAPMSSAKHRYILQDTKRLAAGMGLRIAWPIDTDAWWEPSHLGWLMARRRGRALAFYEAVTAARWERGEDISRPATIRAASTAAGLDADLVAGAVDDDSIRAEGVDCLARAYEEDVFGVPYLRVGWHRFWGLDRLDAFLDAYAARSAAAAPRVTAPGPAGPAYDSDAPGGCG